MSMALRCSTACLKMLQSVAADMENRPSFPEIECGPDCPLRKPCAPLLDQYLHTLDGFAAPIAAEPGDTVFRVGALQAPVILRLTRQDPARYKFIGCVHLSNGMRGRGIYHWDLGDEDAEYDEVKERTKVFEVE